ncbi:MAG: MBL fold metallo-hydrolase [Acidimicrobiia bacterium]
MKIDLSSPEVTAFAEQISTDSLGDHSYIVVVGDEAVAIDIQRDLDRFDDVLDGVDAKLTAVFETHIHNDYVSGGKRLADAHGARYVLPANTGAPYPHTPLADGDTIPLGPWLIRGMHTPGHTHNHMSFVLESDEGPVAIFSGGSMLVGAVGRSDLLGPDDTETLLADQYESVARIASELPDPSIVAPTHGAGSFCSASNVADTTSTVALEKLRNPAILAPNLDAFIDAQLAGYRQFPVYYKHMAPMNLRPAGPPPGEPLPRVSDPASVQGATVVDLRPFAEYAAGHLPRSISVPASTDDATYIAWTLPWNVPLALVGDQQTADDATLHLQRIGWDNVVGRIAAHDLPALANGPLATADVITYADLDAETGPILDVRDPVEHAEGIMEGAKTVHFADFAADPDAFVDEDVVIHCVTGYRASVAAGFAERAGAHATVVIDGLSNYRGRLVPPTA